ncbi:hypothetical protein NK718_17485 [Alsobacter sp. SYSU M60028]|uniref:Uncharacterized protein n=1 Tax=Alsobacter ponti TaxID=2962936 RepID=A0ABT1LFP7_9HYPH|nr:hypothetical protein [Alsobacter ponti]MCP8940322.1 hypothetical protein [Alsobacter ponti]
MRNLPRCGQENVPHLTYWYTPDKDYVGPDEIFLYSEGIKDRYRVTVVK